YPKNEEKEQVIEREREQVSYWYGDYFLLYGVQELKNPPAALWASGGPVPVLGGGTPETKNRPLSDNDRPASRSRKVFYLTKLKIMPQE
nr:hypothetical protein [Bernardetiaceae bacterium]